jgi:V/A-type H+-transporting ATPase subunit I
MKWREALHPVTMSRIALLAPDFALRDVLVQVADEGTVAVDEAPAEPSRIAAPESARGRLAHLQATNVPPALSRTAPDLATCERDGRVDLLAGEAQLETKAESAVRRDNVTALLGWMPGDAVSRLGTRLSDVGGAVVPLRRPSGIDPPTQLPQSGPSRDFDPLVQTYATVPYADVNPSVLAGLAYVLMFGMMFADVGHGAILLLFACAVRWRGSSRLSRLEPARLFLAGAGLSSMLFGALYGEFFGPTGVIPVIWLAPLDHPIPLLGAAVAVGAVLLAGSYALGSVNRFREGGWRRALYAPSGLAGAAVFLGLGLLAAGGYTGLPGLAYLGGAVAAGGLVVAYVGLLAAAGGGAAGAGQAGIELFDLVTRLESNLVSFARLAAFGLTHAALGLVIWTATSSLWGRSGFGVLAAVVVFIVGNAVTFALEGLVAAIQALRLEYYELFSRVFDTEGRPFRPWHVPITIVEEPC